MRFGLVTACVLVLFGEVALPAPGQQRRETQVAGNVETVKNCLVTLIDEAEVPAQEEGTLMDILVREGQQVSKGDILAQIDDTKVKMAENVARYELVAAEAEASNQVNVEYAEAARDVAGAEYQQALDANKRMPNTHPQAEIRRLLLEHRKFSLQVRQSQHELNLAGLNANVKKAQLEAASTDVEHRKIKAPIDGIVVKRYHRVGEWVRPGEPVLRIVRADRLRIEGYLDATKIAPADLADQPVLIRVTLPQGREAEFQGKIVFVSPLVEAGMQFLVHAEVENRQEDGYWLLRPGVPADMTIQLKR